MEKIMKIFDQAMKTMMLLSGIMLVLIMLSVCLEVVLRTFFNMSLIWITEVTEILLLYITFLGAAWVLHEEKHVKVDIILSRIKPRSKAFLGIISSILGIFVSVTLTWYGLKVALDCFHKNLYTPTAMEIPMFLIIIVIPFGCLMLFVQFIRRTLKYMAGFIIESNKINS